MSCSTEPGGLLYRGCRRNGIKGGPYLGHGMRPEPCFPWPLRGRTRGTVREAEGGVGELLFYVVTESDSLPYPDLTERETLCK